mmetsp:Transcript_21/g.70  ORF Transcript_21/g.70 Transcript_21/m.70 type:complete len:286 (+) Transcript_21:477-1334(+)
MRLAECREVELTCLQGGHCGGGDSPILVGFSALFLLTPVLRARGACDSEATLNLLGADERPTLLSSGASRQLEEQGGCELGHATLWRRDRGDLQGQVSHLLSEEALDLGVDTSIPRSAIFCAERRSLDQGSAGARASCWDDAALKAREVGRRHRRRLNAPPLLLGLQVPVQLAGERDNALVGPALLDLVLGERGVPGLACCAQRSLIGEHAGRHELCSERSAARGGGLCSQLLKLRRLRLHLCRLVCGLECGEVLKVLMLVARRAMRKAKPNVESELDCFLDHRV